MTKTLPIAVFDTARVAPREQFAAWRENIAPIFDCAPVKDAVPTPFHGAFESYLMGPLVVGGTSFDSHRYNRDSARVRRDGLNHYHLNLHLSGGYVARFGDREITVEAGDITLFDFARPFAAESLRSELLVVAVPRDLLELSMPPGDHHGLVLRGGAGLGGLLADYIRSLAVRLPSMTAEDATAAAAGTTALVAACFRPSLANFARAGAPLVDSLGNQIRHHIAENLGTDPITTDRICKQFKISRATLYRMFEQFGGVFAYIKNQRLSRAFTTLMDPRQSHQKIADIAFESGFGNETHFSKAFRKAFGMTPSEARSVAADGADIRDWVARLRRK
jgi:AraC-like DNA-binding protein